MATRSDSRTYYDVLHVSRDAPLEIIRGSYRTLMQQLKNHPDLGGDTATAALINEAYAVLTDRQRRVEYDALLDVMAHVVDGVGEESRDSSSPTKSVRILDPFRECVFCETPHNHGRIIETDANCDTCGSPLCPPNNQRMESVGQRAVARFEKQQIIAIYTHWPQQKGFVGHTKDISLNGMRFVTKQDLAVGQRVKIVSSAIEAVGSVTHSVQQRYGLTTRCVAGVSFVTLRFAGSVGGFVSEHV
ncbi:MAG: J domain-containing protein [Gammaproteobacteria bacterium]|nr:J domain-containing protein [Gammaproteobacteria bacterium]